MEFSHELALSLIQSSNPFPINFEQGWQWLGYSSKHKAKEKLKRNFEQGIDFEVFTNLLAQGVKENKWHREQQGFYTLAGKSRRR